jgi:hypothetical protein
MDIPSGEGCIDPMMLCLSCLFHTVVVFMHHPIIFTCNVTYIIIRFSSIQTVGCTVGQKYTLFGPNLHTCEAKSTMSDFLANQEIMCTVCVVRPCYNRGGGGGVV